MLVYIREAHPDSVLRTPKDGKEAFEKIKATNEKTTPLQTACSPEDVADAIVWLIDGARTTTGELLLLDSGRHLGTPAPLPR